MKQKITTEQFSEYLNAVEHDTSSALFAVMMVVDGSMWTSEYYSEIPRYYKKSLARKVARYLMKTALKGSFEADGLANSCMFCEMDNGDQVSFSKEYDMFTFTSEGVKIIAEGRPYSKVKLYTARDHILLTEIDASNFSNIDLHHWRFDVVKAFENKPIEYYISDDVEDDEDLFDNEGNLY